MNRIKLPLYVPRGTPATGAALFVSLVFLLILTLIGLAGMQNTALQEKMAGNLRDSNLAFQAAESALQAGESVIANNPPTFVCNVATDGLYINSNPNNSFPNLPSDCPSYLGWPSNTQANAYPPESNSFWSGNTDVVSLNPNNYQQFKNLAGQPQYILEVLSAGPPNAPGAGVSLEADTPVAPTSTYYRVTAYGVGMSSNSVSIIQSVVRE